MKNSFDPHTLDAILNPESQVHEIRQAIQEDSELLNAKKEVDINKVYTELAGLVGAEKEILNLAKYAVESDPTTEGLLSGISSLTNSIKDTLGMFLKLHNQNIKHQQQLELERYKHECRKELVNMRAVNVPPSRGEDSDLVPFSQEEIVKYLNK